MVVGAGKRDPAHDVPVTAWGLLLRDLHAGDNGAFDGATEKNFRKSQ